MIFEKYFEQVKKFKEELGTLEWLSPREKEIVLGSWLKNPSLHSRERKDKGTKIDSVQGYEEKNINIPESFASLVNLAKSTQHSDYVILAVYKLIFQDKCESVSVKDIAEEYKKAYIKPSNTNVYLANLSKRGLLMPTEKKEGKAAFIITKLGIKYVEDLLNNE